MSPEVFQLLCEVEVAKLVEDIAHEARLDNRFLNLGEALRNYLLTANHAGHGNYLVRADGAVTWETTPNVGPAHDNIWTLGSGPQYQTRLAGTETPATEKDVFLSP